MVEALLLSVLATSPVPVAPTTDEADYAPPDRLVNFNYAFAQVNRTQVGDGATRVSVESNAPTPRWGYFPMHVQIDNLAGPDQTVQLSFNPSSGGARPITKAVRVKAGERTAVTMPVPYLHRYGRLVARGPGITEGGDVYVYFNSIYPPQRAVLLLGATKAFEKLVKKPPAHTGGEVFVYAIAANEAPSELAAYVGYDGVVVPEGGIDQFPENVRRALEAYAALGGSLVFAAGTRGLESALPLAKTLETGMQPYGLGRVVLCERCGDEIRNVLGYHEMQVTPRKATGSRAYRYGPADALKPLLPQATAPVGRFLLIIVAFTLAIGPGSIFVARKRGPAALLVTIPGTAIVTCAIIVGYSVLHDGFAVHSSSHGYTYLDSKRHRALTVGLTAYYANLAPTKAVFPLTTAVIAPAENGAGEPYASSTDWGESAKIGSDFLPARTYREWGFMGAEPTRARLVLKREGGGFKLQNALEHTIASVEFRADDKLWRVENVRAGDEKAAVALGKNNKPALDVEGAKRFPSRLHTFADATLKENEFLAVLDGPGFTPTGGLELVDRNSTHLVRGEME